MILWDWKLTENFNEDLIGLETNKRVLMKI